MILYLDDDNDWSFESLPLYISVFFFVLMRRIKQETPNNYNPSTVLRSFVLFLHVILSVGKTVSRLGNYIRILIHWRIVLGKTMKMEKFGIGDRVQLHLDFIMLPLIAYYSYEKQEILYYENYSTFTAPSMVYCSCFFFGWLCCVAGGGGKCVFRSDFPMRARVLCDFVLQSSTRGAWHWMVG